MSSQAVISGGKSGQRCRRRRPPPELREKPLCRSRGFLGDENCCLSAAGNVDVMAPKPVGPVVGGSTQSGHTGGAGGHEGSGDQPAGGCQPGGATGQPGGGLNLIAEILPDHCTMACQPNGG